VFIEAKDDGGGGDDWTTGAISHAINFQSNHHHQQTNIQAGCPSCHQTNSVKALKGKRAALCITTNLPLLLYNVWWSSVIQVLPYMHCIFIF